MWKSLLRRIRDLWWFWLVEVATWLRGLASFTMTAAVLMWVFFSVLLVDATDHTDHTEDKLPKRQ